MEDKISAGEILRALPWEDLLEVADTAMQDGGSAEEVQKALADIIDDAVDFSKIIDGPVGVALEAADGAVITAAIGLVRALAGDKEAREARQERRQKRRAERKARREARRAKRS
tara:strand:+ start:868 stop:1209 length:342 start_codon:yes stop_codon:yes gene_type:complete